MARCYLKRRTRISKLTTPRETEPAMFCLSNLSINKTVAQANVPDSDSSPVRSNDPTPPLRSRKTVTLPRKKLRSSSPQPSVIQIERIVGTGSFRDGEPADPDMRKSVFDLFLGKTFEGPVEKKLRETGEWLVTNTEDEFRSAGKRTLMFVFQWMLPIFAMSLLIASGVIKLPFSSPFLDNLIM